MKKILIFLTVALTVLLMLCSCEKGCDHIDSEWITDKEANCTEDGSRHQVCLICGETVKTETIPATGHTAGEWITDKEANCTEDGSRHQVCATCGETLITQTISATGHTFGAKKTTKVATCTENGEEEQVCSCGEKKTQTIPATGHKWENATCTSPQKCLICGTTGELALGHNYVNGICQRCGASLPVPKVSFSDSYYSVHFVSYDGSSVSISMKDSGTIDNLKAFIKVTGNDICEIQLTLKGTMERVQSTKSTISFFVIVYNEKGEKIHREFYIGSRYAAGDEISEYITIGGLPYSESYKIKISNYGI